MERFLIPNDSYIDIQKDDVDGKMYITVTVELKKEYKKGDILTYRYPDEDGIGVIIFNKIENNRLYFLAGMNRGGDIGYDNYYIGAFQLLGFADDKYRQKLFNAMEKDGKRWNDDEKCVEDIPQRKFKAGDKVRIKDGISSKTVSGNTPAFNPIMDDFIGTTMTVNRYTDMCGYVVCEEASWRFLEDWLEPYTDELKKGDLVIFWDSDQTEARIGVYNQFYDGSPFPHEDHIGNRFKNAVKFESKKQFKRFIKGEL